MRRWQGSMAGRGSEGNELAGRLVGRQAGRQVGQTGFLEHREQTSVRLGKQYRSHY